MAGTPLGLLLSLTKNVASTKTQTATARIAISGTSNRTGTARISNSYSKTQTGTSRIANGRAQTVSGTGRIKYVGTFFYTPFGLLSSITRQVSSPYGISQVAGTSRIRTSLSKSTTGLSSIAKSFTATQPALSRISVGATATRSGSAVVVILPTVPQSGRARIGVSRTSDQPGAAHVTNSPSKQIAGIARISYVGTYLNVPLGILTSITHLVPSPYGTRLQPGVGRISTPESIVLSAIARVANAYSLTQTAGAYIVTPRSANQGATARMYNPHTTTTHPGDGFITSNWTPTGWLLIWMQPPQFAGSSVTSGNSRVALQVIRGQGGSALIVFARALNQQANAAVRKVMAKALAGTANITLNPSRQVFGRADVRGPATRRQFASAYLVGRVVRFQSASALVQKNLAIAQPGTAHVVHPMLGAPLSITVRLPAAISLAIYVRT